MISVIIPSYNSENTIGGCLGSLTSQTYRGNYEIIVVDSSEDGTCSIVETDFPAVKLVHFDRKTDPGTARNVGIQRAEGEIIAFIDSDCIAAHDWLERIAEAHASSYKIVGGVVENGNSTNDLVGRAGYLAEFREFLPGKARQEVKHIPTCNISYDKEVFRRFGLFEGEFYPQEDLVYNYNLWTNGERILLEPNIRVRHVHRSRLGEFLNHQNKIGLMTAKVLKRLPLEGSFLARHALISVPLLPFLVMVKFFRTLSTFLKYQSEFVKQKPFVVIPLLVGLSYWGVGFIRGVCERDQPSRGSH